MALTNFHRRMLTLTRNSFSGARTVPLNRKLRSNSSRSTFCTRSQLSIEDQLQDMFKLKNTKVSNWIIENKAKSLCTRYLDSNKEDRRRILCTLASRYAVPHENVCNTAKKLLCEKTDNESQMLAYEKTLKDLLTPPYHWLFVAMGRLEEGVKFLVDLRTDVLELTKDTKDTKDYAVVQQLNSTLQDILLLWFSVGFLHMERITWQTSCDILEKVSNYEAIHPIRNWVDLKRRVGPYRRCYVFTHPSMPREPIVLLHTALCDVIPDSVKGIEEAQGRILGANKKELTFAEEDKSKIKAAIFYSIASTQKGLQGIELGNYLIKEAAKEVVAEFPMLDQLSSLSPIPGFREWLLEKTKQNASSVFTREEREALKRRLNTEDVSSGLRQTFNNCLWTNDEALSETLRVPLLRACAWYLYKEKRRNYALNKVANFHLRNGSVMWRINWMADPSPRGVANSCGVMVNYRYYLNDCETNSRSYIENYFVNASEGVIKLAQDAEELRSGR